MKINKEKSILSLPLFFLLNLLIFLYYILQAANKLSIFVKGKHS